MDNGKSKISFLLGGLILILVASFGLLIISNRTLTHTIENQKKELVTLAKEQDISENAYKALQADLKETQTFVVEELTGFSKDELSNDESIVTSYLNTIFTWTNGKKYDEQRQIIKEIGAKGTDRLLSEIMPENIRVEVPEDLKATIKDNDIDINGLRSILLDNQFNRLSWDKSTSAAISYTSLISYQVYINEADLEGDYKTIRKLLFTFKVSGIDKERKIVDVKYAFVP